MKRQKTVLVAHMLCGHDQSRRLQVANGVPLLIGSITFSAGNGLHGWLWGEGWHAGHPIRQMQSGSSCVCFQIRHGKATCTVVSGTWFVWRPQVGDRIHHETRRERRPLLAPPPRQGLRHRHGRVQRNRHGRAQRNRHGRRLRHPTAGTTAPPAGRTAPPAGERGTATAGAAALPRQETAPPPRQETAALPRQDMTASPRQEPAAPPRQGTTAPPRQGTTAPPRQGTEEPPRRGLRHRHGRLQRHRHGGNGGTASAGTKARSAYSIMTCKTTVIALRSLTSARVESCRTENTRSTIRMNSWKWSE